MKHIIPRANSNAGTSRHLHEQSSEACLALIYTVNLLIEQNAPGNVWSMRKHPRLPINNSLKQQRSSVAQRWLLIRILASGRAVLCILFP